MRGSVGSVRDLEEPVTVTAVRLDVIHRCVGVAEQSVGGRAVVGDPNADTDRERVVETAGLNGLGDETRNASADRLGQCQRLEVFGDVEDDRELIATDARDGVVGARRKNQALRSKVQNVVADGVAVVVVDPLEAIKIADQDGDVPASCCAAQGVLKSVMQQPAVRQPGQLVVQRSTLEAFLNCHDVGDVARHHEDRRHVVRLVAGEWSQSSRQPPDFAVVVPHAMTKRHHLAVRQIICLPVRTFEVEHVLVGHQFVEVVAAEHLHDFGGEADERFARTIRPAQLLRRDVVQVNRVGCRSDDRLLVAQRPAQLGVRFVRLDLGLDEFGDVRNSAGHLRDDAVGIAVDDTVRIEPTHRAIVRANHRVANRSSGRRFQSVAASPRPTDARLSGCTQLIQHFVRCP